MTTDFQKLFGLLQEDSWRTQTPFTTDVAQTAEALYASQDDESAVRILRDWLARYQPCLFGRMAAKADLIQFCILRESDVLGDSVRLRDKIQTARTEWTRQGFEGRKSAFVIILLSKTLASCIPDSAVQDIAVGLTQSYLLRDIEIDVVYHDEMFLEKPGTQRTAWKWLAGINYFSAQADGRWWQDHRIPGGIALSINSVGHMVKSGQLATAAAYLDEVLGGPPEQLGNDRLDSLSKALSIAMKTIDMASESVSGRATYLLPEPLESISASRPAEFPASLNGKNHVTYEGWYHTDITIPSLYFRSDVTRPSDIKSIPLDFSYLFDDSVDNPDHVLMGKGRRIRAGQRAEKAASTTETRLQ